MKTITVPTIDPRDYGFTVNSDVLVGREFSVGSYVGASMGVVFLDMELDGPTNMMTSNVWLPIEEDQKDSTDINPFRQYQLTCGDNLWAELLGVATMAKELEGKTVAQIDKMLVRGCNYTRMV